MTHPSLEPAGDLGIKTMYRNYAPSNRLTLECIQTIVEIKMLKALQRANLGVLMKRHTLLCFSLLVFLLCNPFAASSSCSHKSDIHRLPSYRATIASAELLKAKNPEGQDGVTIPANHTVATPTIALPQLTASLESRIETILPASDHLPFGNLWFRPPPIA